MFEILEMRRIHNIHGPHATDMYVYAYIPDTVNNSLEPWSYHINKINRENR